MVSSYPPPKLNTEKSIIDWLLAISLFICDTGNGFPFEFFNVCASFLKMYIYQDFSVAEIKSLEIW